MEGNQFMKNRNIMFATVLLVLGCFWLASRVQAVGPDSDGAIAGSNNGEGIGVLVSRTTGIWNTGTGFQALNHLTGGNQNTATGFRALSSDINGGFNTATGVLSLFSNTSGFFNSATGAYSLANNTDGDYNTANGYSALYYNTEGGYNTATGFGALYRNTTGVGNTASGYGALANNTTGNDNTANGSLALASNTEGNYNTANGYAALANNATGGFNKALGLGAGSAVTTASNVIAIGSPGANVDNSCFIGNIHSNVQPIVGTDPDSVTVTSAGRLGRGNISSRRYKHDIKPMDKASEALFALKPVSFHYKKEFDATQTLAYGLIAEEVAEVYPDLVGRTPEGQPESVRYKQINAMLLNEFLKEHGRVEQQARETQEQKNTISQLETTVGKQGATIAQQQKEVQALTASLTEQAKQIQKVSAQLQLSKPAPRTVVQNQ